ncbi:hypothetical protein SAMN06265379_1152 [Saccharicrinis carchari]|uniref:Uncharacterized protein n=1 Tax=Saccharicrinis carchari TaxID=1168039 RepID=A0A521F839_SACCC|nr:hypothetical protein SAMN06265379_1152 [Saccharicrinis carchari]
MIFFEGERIKLKDLITIEHVTIFRITGECLFDKEHPIDEYLDFLQIGDETLLAVLNTKSKTSRIIKFNRKSTFFSTVLSQKCN